MGPDDVETIIPVIFERAHHYFNEFWTNLTGRQRRLLAGLARDRDDVDNSLQPAAETLVRKEVLERTAAGYCFQVPLLRRWVMQQTAHGDDPLA